MESGDCLQLFWVLFDGNCGIEPVEWERDHLYPEPLKEALDHAADLKRKGWITKIETAA
jgi:hypothetical protein